MKKGEQEGEEVGEGRANEIRDEVLGSKEVLTGEVILS